MALVVKDRVLETSNTNGTGTFTLAGAVNGFQAFSVIGVGNTTYYAITEETNNQWEVGLGTVGSGTLTRDTVLSSSNGGSKVDFADGLKQVFCDYPANKAVYLDASGNVSSLGTITSGVWNGSTIPVANGGTGVTTSSGANSVVLRDANVNINANAFNDGYTNTAASGTPIVLTVSSVRRFTITGSGGQTIKLPDATTLVNGEIFEFDNNQSSGAITVNNNSNTLVVSVPSGGLVRVNLLSNSIAAGSWDRHDYAPANVSWSTNTFDYAGSITSATWNGTAVAINRGGTGASTASTAFNALSPLTTAGDTLYGGTSGAGTRLAIGTAGQVLTVNSGATAPQWSTPATGTVTSVGGTGTVSGISLSGTVTSSGNLTLGGTLDLSSPPAIGGTTPAAGTFTTLTSSGTATLANSSTTYVTVTGDASYPMIKATGGTNTPLVLSPLGTGALQAQKTDSTATGGNARGANAVDWQTSRATATQVASSSFSVIGGGANNTASTSNGTTIAGGRNNNSTAQDSFVGGGNANTASGLFSSSVGGANNVASGYYGFVGGGQTNSTSSNSAVTTQSGTMNATTAVTLSGSNASIKVGQLITGTSISTNTYVAAISGTSLTLSQNASGSSTSTLSFFTPHGVVVGGGNNQATGSYSFIGGGGDAGTAANRNVASGAWSAVVGGIKNTASGQAAFVGSGGTDGSGFYANTASGVSSGIVAGTNNNVSGTTSFIGAGITNNITGSYAVIGSGANNTASGTFSSILGGYYGTTRSIDGNNAIAACNIPIASSAGVSQAALLILAVQTTDATATILRSNSSAASGTNQVILPNNSAYYFTGEIISGVTGGGDSKGWSISGVIKRGANAAATTLVGSTVTSLYADAGAATWTIALAADTTNGGLKVTFTGQASTTIRTVCQIRTTEMTY